MLIETVILSELTTSERNDLTTRSAVPDPSVREEARQIVASIRDGGDEALAECASRFGGGLATRRLRVSPAQIKESLTSLPDELRHSLESAIHNIRAVHTSQRPVDSVTEPTPGVVVERRWAPLRRVGVYVPGGRAAYPSSLLMGVVPAQIAGVEEIAVATPSDGESRMSSTVLAAAAMLGVDEVFAIGGAQAIGALAYGTPSVPAVDKIVGPGGPWVTAAKLAVFGDCAIDLPAGPSEALIVVDETADSRVAGADLLCQAEHGPESPIVLVATTEQVARAVLSAAATQVVNLERENIIRDALTTLGLVVIADDRDEALAFADEWAPEHLTLHVSSPSAAADAVPSAGSVFVGHWTPESAGDYATGANHVLPTGGQAAAYGPLSVEDFGSWRQLQTLDETGLRTLAPTIRSLAMAEGLTAHARCVDVRLSPLLEMP